MQPSGSPSTLQSLTAFTYAQQNIDFDIGIATGLNRASQDYSAFFDAVLPVLNFGNYLRFSVVKVRWRTCFSKSMFSMSD